MAVFSATRTSAYVLRGLLCVSQAFALARAADPQPRPGGALIVGERAQPKTLNPAFVADDVAREIRGLIHADLVHINASSQVAEPALATSWTISRDGKRYVVKLRRDARFSDGHPFDADDVLFTWRVATDEKVHSPQRDLLVMSGKPIAARKIDSYTVEFQFPEPYGPAERIFDSIAILPRHVLEPAYREGRFDKAWPLNADPASVVGLGPFRLKQYTAGRRLVLEKNPYYWKTGPGGLRLPYLDSVVFDFSASESAQVLRLESGDVDLVSRISAANFEALSSRNGGRWQLRDVGPGLEYSVLFFNMNDLPATSSMPKFKQAWFADTNFRRAISAAIDRESIARLVYSGRATPIWTNVAPGNKLWVNTALPKPARSLDRARALLSASGFKWNRNGRLEDKAGNAVEFSIAASSSNPERAQTATIIQDDLKKLGIAVRTLTFESRSLIDRVMNTLDYEAALLGLGGGDADPGPEMGVLLSTGGMHLWRLRRTVPEPAWQQEIDRLMQAQMASPSRVERKRAYDRVQQLVLENAPMIPLASPNILCAARSGVANFKPAILPPYALGNADELYWAARPPGR